MPTCALDVSTPLSKLAMCLFIGSPSTGCASELMSPLDRIIKLMCCSLFWPGRPEGSGWRKAICIHYAHLYKSFVASYWSALRINVFCGFERFCVSFDVDIWVLRGEIRSHLKYWTLFGDLSKAKSVEKLFCFRKAASNSLCVKSESFRQLEHQKYIFPCKSKNFYKFELFQPDF